MIKTPKVPTDTVSTITRIYRKLEELNVIDNFLFQQILSQEKDGETFARILLSVILDKPIRRVSIVPQKNALLQFTDRQPDAVRRCRLQYPT